MELKDIMMLYGVTLGSRKTRRKKNLFIQTVLDTCKQDNIQASVVRGKEKMITTTSIVIGNLKTAKYVFLTGFDTPSKYFTPLNYYPFHPEKSSRAENVKNVIRLLFVILLAIGAYFPLKEITSHNTTVWNVFSLIILLLGIVILLFPKANTYNFSKSSSIAVMMKILEDTQNKSDVAYVLSDYSSSGYLGFESIKDQINKNSNVIILGPLASGSKMVVAYKENNEKLGKLLANNISSSVIQKKYTQEEATRNCLTLFQNCVYVVCGDIEKKEFVVKNTACSKDVSIDMNRLQEIVDGLEKEINNH